MVFAIPIGASAETDDLSWMYKPSDNTSYDFKSFIVWKNGNTYYRRSYTFSDAKYVYFSADSTLAVVSPSKPSAYGTILESWTVGSDKRMIHMGANYYGYVDYTHVTNSESRLGEIVYSPVDVTINTLDGSVFFRNPPKPVQLQAVKTVQEIVPQAGAVAGGIVLVASIILGLWLLIGLVKRLVYSFLR